MGYLFLALAVFAGVVKGYCGKKTSGFVRGTAQATLASTIRMSLCIAVGFLVVAAGSELSYLAPTSKLIAVSALSGISTSVFVVSWMLAVKKGAYMMVEVFLMLGVLVPIIFGKIFFDESVLLKHAVGLAILVVAVLLMCSYNNSVKAKLTLSSLLLLTLCGFSSGVADFSQKLFVNTLSDVPASVFNFYTYVFSTVVLVIVYAVFKRGQSNETGEFKLKKVLPYIVVMSVCLFANSFFKTMAAYHLDSAMLYPLNQGTCLVLATFMSAIAFKEKITPKSALGIAISFVGLLIINVL